MVTRKHTTIPFIKHPEVSSVGAGNSTTEQVRASQRRRLLELYEPEELSKLTHRDYPTVRKHLGWSQATFRTALGFLGIKDKGTLRASERDYVATDAEVAILMEVVDRDLITVLALTGCRFGELWRMELNGSSLYVFSQKGGAVVRHSLRSLSRELRETIQRWVNRGSSELSYQAAKQRWFRAIRGGKHPGLSAECTAHSLRHRVATLMNEAGEPVEAIAAYLGHRSLDTTRRYTHPETLAKNSERLVPTMGNRTPSKLDGPVVLTVEELASGYEGFIDG